MTHRPSNDESTSQGPQTIEVSASAAAAKLGADTASRPGPPLSYLLPDTEVRYRTLIEQIPATIYIAEYGAEGRWYYLSPKIRDVLGYAPEDFLANSSLWFGLVHPEDRTRVAAAEEQASKNGGPFHHEYRLKDRRGTYRWFHDDGVSLPHEPGRAPLVHGILYDIHDRKMMEIALRESEERLSLALGGSGISLWDYDCVTGRIFMDDEWSAMLGGERKITLTTVRELQSLIHPDDRDMVRQQVIQALKGEKELYSEDHRVRNCHGNYVWVHSSGRVVERSPDGRAVRAIGTHRDISERQQREAALRESEQLLSQALAAAHMGAWRWDAATNSTSWDANERKLLGVSETHPASLASVIELIVPEDREKFTTAVDRCAKTGEVYKQEFRIMRPDGHIRWLADHGEPEFDASGRIVGFRGVIRDITEERELEEQLRRAQRMESIGQLASGVAHDFNNLLMVIRGNTEYMLEHAAEGSVFHKNSEAILRAADRAAGITRQLLAFSRKQVVQPRVVELGSAVHETTNLVRSLLGPTIRLDVKLPADPLRVLADSSQLEQVVLNLVLNARDALPQGGTITVSVDRVPANSDVLRRHLERKDCDYILLTVHDTGIGMDEATRERIFEPFFTTKDIGKGTGLGLATVYGIVEQSQGWITVQSSPGQGATFHVFLPQAAAAEQVEAPAPEGTLCGTETLLVVDDEEAIRELTTVFLGGQGYRVLSASSGEEALDLMRRHSDPIHALITDALMPGMGGMTLAKRLREQRPAIKILFISGYADDTGILSDFPRTGEDYLQKPFGLKELAEKVRRLLNGHGPDQGTPAPLR